MTNFWLWWLRCPLLTIYIKDRMYWKGVPARPLGYRCNRVSLHLQFESFAFTIVNSDDLPQVRVTAKQTSQNNLQTDKILTNKVAKT